MTRPVEVIAILVGVCWLDGATRTLSNLTTMLWG